MQPKCREEQRAHVYINFYDLIQKTRQTGDKRANAALEIIVATLPLPQKN
jgi:hypothetical protein